MESGGSSPHSQELATYPNPEPDQSNPLSHFLEMYVNIIVPSKLRSSSYLTPVS
jgi:hypothetical protein